MPSVHDKITIRRGIGSDLKALTKCFVELQNFERLIEPRRQPGEQIAAVYVQGLLKRCGEEEGRVFVATAKNQIIGFACVFPREMLDEQINEPTTVAYLSDLVVSSAFRQRGIGQMLMSAAEQYAKELGVAIITVNVLAANEAACKFYDSCGYEEYEHTLVKRLR